MWRLWRRLREVLAAWNDEVRTQALQSAVLHADETGWRVNGSEDGAETQAVLMSVFRILKQRGHNPVSAVTEAVRASLQTKQLPPLPAKLTELG